MVRGDPTIESALYDVLDPAPFGHVRRCCSLSPRRLSQPFTALLPPGLQLDLEALQRVDRLRPGHRRPARPRPDQLQPGGPLLLFAFAGPARPLGRLIALPRWVREESGGRAGQLMTDNSGCCRSTSRVISGRVRPSPGQCPTKALFSAFPPVSAQRKSLLFSAAPAAASPPPRARVRQHSSLLPPQLRKIARPLPAMLSFPPARCVSTVLIAVSSAGRVADEALFMQTAAQTATPPARFASCPTRRSTPTRTTCPGTTWRPGCTPPSRSQRPPAVKRPTVPFLGPAVLHSAVECLHDS